MSHHVTHLNESTMSSHHFLSEPFCICSHMLFTVNTLVSSWAHLNTYFVYILEWIYIEKKPFLKYIHTYIYIYTNICVHVYTYMCTYMYLCIYIYIYIYTHTCMSHLEQPPFLEPFWVCVRCIYIQYIHTYTYTYKHIQIHTYIYIYTYTHTRHLEQPPFLAPFWISRYDPPRQNWRLIRRSKSPSSQSCQSSLTNRCGTAPHPHPRSGRPECRRCRHRCLASNDRMNSLKN